VGSTEVYRAAGSDEASAIDAYIMEHMSGELLLGEGEAELIGRGWVEP
jgi:hypothetical protein